MSQETHIENLAKAEMEIVRRQPLMQNANMRQHYHFMPPTGWMNDPNGLIFFRGQYHYFYQYNPYDAYWGAMHWGHAVSDDLLHWEQLPIALAPSESYDDHERGGCFSGSAIEHEGKLWLLYTGTANHGNGFVQTQCLAVSDDGVHFQKYNGNPVISAPEGYDPANFRDPKVWKHEEKFYMICGAKKDDLAQALLFCSDDLGCWEFINVLHESRGELGYMWECPDFFPLGNKYVLMFSPMGLHERTTVYLVGDMDYGTGKFHPIITGEIDWGFDYYAPQSFMDDKGRRLIVAWANAWDWMPWFKDWGPTYKEQWCGSFALTREAKLCPDNTLQFVPVEELQRLRYKEKKLIDFIVGENECLFIESGDGISCEILMEIDLQATTATEFSLLLRCSDTLRTVVQFDLSKSVMSVNRNSSDGWSQGKTRSPLTLGGKTSLSVHVYLDQSSVEIFTDQYRTAHSCNIFAGNDQNKNFITVMGGTLQVKTLLTWGLKLGDGKHV